jgi:integrase
MTFAFARIGAVVAMRVEDYYPKGKRWWVRLHEKGGKRHEMPAHHNLEAYLDAYIEAAGIRDGGKTPLFRSAAGRTGTLTDKPMNRVDAWRMIQRRAAELGTRASVLRRKYRLISALRCDLRGGLLGWRGQSSDCTRRRMSSKNFVGGHGQPPSAPATWNAPTSFCCGSTASALRLPPSG